MSKVIAVDDDLLNVREALKVEGYRTVGLKEGIKDGAVGVVVSGMEENFLGIENVETKVPVFSMRGRTVEEVIDEIKRTLH